MITIVIPCYNGWSLTHQLLFDIYNNCNEAQVVVVDDKSTEVEVQKGLSWWSNLMGDKLSIYTNEENSGFLRTANFGVEKAQTEMVILISNDVRINDKSLCEKVSTALQQNDGKLNLVGARLLDRDTGWNTFRGVTFPYLEGWLLAFHKSEWSNFGGFDERYAPYDFEDVDISTTYLHKGGHITAIMADVQHMGAQTYKYSEAREKQTKTNQKKFEEKWTK